MSVPRFTLTDGVQPEPSKEYYFTKFDQDYPVELAKWERLVGNTIKSQPAKIRKINQTIKQYENAPGVVTAEQKQNQQQAISTARMQLSAERATQDKCKVAERDLKKARKWYDEVHKDISYLIDNLRIDFELQRKDSTGSPETLVSTRGGQ